MFHYFWQKERNALISHAGLLLKHLRKNADSSNLIKRYYFNELYFVKFDIRESASNGPEYPNPTMDEKVKIFVTANYDLFD